MIRSIVLTLTHSYGVHQIMGVRYGYAGLSAYPPEPPMELTPERVEGLLGQGGSLLASSRGPQDVPAMVEMLFQQRIDALFAIGGDGTMRGAEALSDEVARRRLPIAVMGIPKTIDNDVAWIDHSFGFSTAVEEARRAIAAAHLEATSRWNGVGVVELEGRDSGLIAAHAALSNPHVNFCLVPELPFPIDGECGLLWALERRLEARHHAVVVVASGASPAPQAAEEWAAGGIARGGRSGRYLRDRIEQHFRARREVIHLSYIDPSHLMRTSAANATDSELCLHLGQHAVHAAMAGRTCLLIGSWHGHFTHVPLGLATARPRRIDPRGSLWQSVLESTGQHMCLRGQRPQDSSPPRA